MIHRIILGALASLGLLISTYFSSVYHRVAPSAKYFIPAFCRLDSSDCTTLLQTRESRLFGVPNFDLAILYYAGLLISAIIPALWKQLFLLLFLGSLVTVATGFYLSYVLVFRLRINCLLCFASHAINILIFLLFLPGPS